MEYLKILSTDFSIKITPEPAKGLQVKALTTKDLRPKFDNHGGRGPNPEKVL